MEAKPTGLSRLIMGTMRLGKWGANFTKHQYAEFVEVCLENGIDTFDLADIYGDHTQEADFGAGLEGTDLRSKIRIITKCGICRPDENRSDYKLKHYNTSKEHIIASVENSLRHLKSRYIDLLLLHRPDALMDADEVAEAFTRLKMSGKVLAFGVSNFTPSQFDLLKDRFPLVTNQIQANLLHLAPFLDGSLDHAQQHRYEVQAWSPLGGGAMFEEDPEDERIERIREAAEPLRQKYGATLDQILLAWLLRHPSGIRPVIGTTKLTRIHVSAKALEIDLERDEWYSLWSASTGAPVP